ncbi:MAG: apolipoprotein N-acyltransferase [Steroidobacteraceae bacterium]
MTTVATDPRGAEPVAFDRANGSEPETVLATPDRLRALLPLGVLLLAGGLSALGFAPLNLWPLTFLSLALLIHHVIEAKRLRQALARGWVFGAAHFLIGLNWIATAFTYQDNMPAWIGWAAVLLLSFYLALFPALAGALAWRVSRQHRLGFVCVFAAAWMLSEWSRATLLTGFAWNPLAVVYLELPWAARGARWIGTYGLSGLWVLTAGLFWLGMRHRWRATLALTLVLGVIALALSDPMAPGRGMVFGQQPAAAGAIPFRIVQPNIGEDEKYDPEQAERNAHRYAKLSGQPTSVPRLLLWPEGATLRFLDIEPQARVELAAVLGPHDLLVTGGPSVKLDLHGNDDVYHNSVFALDGAAAIRWRYDKAHLVPFGEYLPAREILGRIGLSRLVPGEGDFLRGPGPRTFALPGFNFHGMPASVGVQICYEIIFSGRVVDEARRPTFLFNPSNDAWFGAWGPPQHLAQAQLRAIEEGIAVLRATPNGVSALISPTGRLVSIVPSHRAGLIDGFIPEPLPPTPFSRFGLWTCLLFGLCLGATGIVLSRRRAPGAS